MITSCDHSCCLLLLERQTADCLLLLKRRLPAVARTPDCRSERASPALLAVLCVAQDSPAQTPLTSLAASNAFTPVRKRQEQTGLPRGSASRDTTETCLCRCACRARVGSRTCRTRRKRADQKEALSMLRCGGHALIYRCRTAKMC